MHLIPILAQVSGNSVVNGVILVIVFGVIFWLLWWLIGYCGLPEPFNKVARIILAIAAVILLINVLLGFTGHPLFTWHT